MRAVPDQFRERRFAPHGCVIEGQNSSIPVVVVVLRFDLNRHIEKRLLSLDLPVSALS